MFALRSNSAVGIAILFLTFHSAAAVITELTTADIPAISTSTPDLIPDVYSYLPVLRDRNSGVKNPHIENDAPSDVLEQLPYRPRDPGLYGSNVRACRDSSNIDRAVIDCIRVYQPQQ